MLRASNLTISGVSGISGYNDESFSEENRRSPVLPYVRFTVSNYRLQIFPLSLYHPALSPATREWCELPVQLPALPLSGIALVTNGRLSNGDPAAQ
jgi:hypothetical protein